MKKWRKHLHRNYAHFAEFAAYSGTYNLAARLGYDSPESAWMDDPLIEGSVEPRDFRVVPPAEHFWLPSGVRGFFNDEDPRGWTCTGTHFGRRDTLPEREGPPVKFRLLRLPFVDQCYDRWGVYWGAPANVWCAWSGPYRVFVRANTRSAAKGAVLLKVSGAKFFR